MVLCGSTLLLRAKARVNDIVYSCHAIYPQAVDEGIALNMGIGRRFR